ncbi:hypothetical protein M5689_008326 [Euphorbia peplus]|nr:hypothetical protein M5689_008326 [Euphorbia peplus]
MGNCMRTSKIQVREDEEDYDKKDYENYHYHHDQEEQQEEEEVKESGNKIKIVLKKEELEWLMYELKTNQGKKLEHVLQEIERERERERSQVKVWKPSLERIIECPEVF